jgi:hypothetical protein
MTATTTTAVLVPIQPAFTDAERLALAGFLAGYRGLTREAYALDLRQFATWCRNQACRCAMCKRPPHMRIRAPQCGMTGARGSLDRHSTYIVAAYVAGAAR